MPQKTIYVKDENVSLYEKAEKIAGTNISNVIADLLREYVKNSEESFEIHAVCYVEETADGVPRFEPDHFISGGTPIDIKFRLQGRYEFPIYVIPLFYADAEIKEKFHSTDSQDIVPFDQL